MEGPRGTVLLAHCPKTEALPMVIFKYWGMMSFLHIHSSHIKHSTIDSSLEVAIIQKFGLLDKRQHLNASFKNVYT